MQFCVQKMYCEQVLTVLNNGYLDFSYLGLFVPWTICTVSGLFVPWTVRVQTVQGTKVQERYKQSMVRTVQGSVRIVREANNVRV